MKAKHHYSKQEILQMCKDTARNRRLAETSPYTAMPIVCLYVALKSEKFKQKRLERLVKAINEMDEDIHQGNIQFEDMQRELEDKCGWKVEFDEFQEEDIKAKRGTFDYWMSLKHIEPSNTINRLSTMYLTMFYLALSQVFGYGPTRITRVKDATCKLFEDYEKGVVTLADMRSSLLEEAGILVEDPKDCL